MVLILKPAIRIFFKGDLLKQIVILFFMAALALLGCVQQPVGDGQRVLTVYTYDSMVSEYGLGPKVVPEFEKQCN